MTNNIERLRTLAQQVKEISQIAQNERTQTLWTAMNDKKMIRPMVVAYDYPIYTAAYKDELTNQITDDPFLAKIESELLLRIYNWKHARCDWMYDDVIYSDLAIHDSGLGVDITTNDTVRNDATSANTTAVDYVAQISCLEDIAKIQDPIITHDVALSNQRFALLQDIFGDILQVQKRGIDNVKLFAMWDDLLTLTGIEEGMYLFYDEPEMMEAMANRYVDAWISRIRQLEEQGLLTNNNSGAVAGRGGLGFTSLLPAKIGDGLGAKAKDMWGFACNQIFTSVSHDMHEQFGAQLEKRFTDQFGLIYYGCCECMDNKMDIEKRIANMHKISVSPYTNTAMAFEALGSDYVLSIKADSMRLAETNPDFQAMTKELEDVCRLAHQHHANVEIVLKTIISLGGNPENLWKWCSLAEEIVNTYS